MRYLKLMPYCSMAGASRNMRELCAAHEYGYEIAVLSSDEKMPQEVATFVKKHVVGGDPFKKVSSFFPLRIVYGIIRRIARYYSLIRKTKSINADIISCHDLSALIIGFWTSLFSKKHIYLIYDSHELEIGRYCNTRYPKLRYLKIKALEGVLIKCCSFAIVVNEGIADTIADLYHLKQKPIVVRSTPHNWTISEEKQHEIRAIYLKKMNYDVEKIIIFHGNLVRSLGIDSLLELVEKDDRIGLVLMGNKTMPDYWTEIEESISKKGIGKRVLQIDAVPYGEICNYVGAADAEVVLVDPVVKSYYYGLPNKFFESIQALTPLLTSNLPEMKRIIDIYGIGYCCNNKDIDFVYKKLCDLLFDVENYSRFKENLLKAKEDLCWENEKKVLLDAYRNYIG